MIIHSASQLLTIAGSPQRGLNLGDLKIIKNGALYIKDGKIKAIGKSPEILKAYPNEEIVDAKNKVVMPGFVDPHTHVVWAGNRAAEFEMKLEGKSYLDILAAGGGILSTVKDTRNADFEKLKRETKNRIKQMLKYGTTTAEVKTGYGLDIETELKMLKVILSLDKESEIDLFPTFLGAHAIAPEFKDEPDKYTNYLCKEILPAVFSWWELNVPNTQLPFVDVFCETGAFDLEQSRRILSVAKKLGFPLKIHADEFDNLGGGALAAEFEAISADHLVVTSDSDIKQLSSSNTVSVALPGTPFGLGHHDYTPAKKILENNGLLAIATDLNPGTTWCESMQMAIALACRYMKLTPAQAIVAATLNAAAAIGQDKQIGSLDVGKKADVLILSIDDYRQLGYRYGINLVDTVIKKGKILKAEEGFI